MRVEEDSPSRLLSELLNGRTRAGAAKRRLAALEREMQRARFLVREMSAAPNKRSKRPG